MNVKRKWKPGGRERQRAVTMAWLNKRKQSFGGGDYERLLADLMENKEVIQQQALPAAA